jgi:hypothetical protein
LRMVEELLAAQGICVTYETVRQCRMAFNRGLIAFWCMFQAVALRRTPARQASHAVCGAAKVIKHSARSDTGV